MGPFAPFLTPFVLKLQDKLAKVLPNHKCFLSSVLYFPYLFPFSSFFKIYLFIYFYLHWAFVAAHRLPLVVASEG